MIETTTPVDSYTSKDEENIQISVTKSHIITIFFTYQL